MSLIEASKLLQIVKPVVLSEVLKTGDRKLDLQTTELGFAEQVVGSSDSLISRGATDIVTAHYKSQLEE